MDVEIYRNFLVVVSNGTISGAARQLNMTQPALSMQMKTLQNSIGQELLIKGQGSHSLILTSAGEIVYNKALKICQLEDKLQRELEEKNEGLRGTLQIPVFHWDDEFLVKWAIPAFHAKYPLVKFSLNWVNSLTLEGSNHQTVCRVMLKKDLVAYQENFDILYKGELKMFVAARKDDLWFKGKKGPLNLRSLDGIPLAMADNPSGRGIVNQMYHYGVEPNVLVWSNYRRGALKAVGGGMCVAVVFQADDTRDYPELNFYPLEDEELIYNYVISKPKGMKLSPLLDRFVEFTMAYHKEWQENKK